MWKKRTLFFLPFTIFSSFHVFNLVDRQFRILFLLHFCCLLFCMCRYSKHYLPALYWIHTGLVQLELPRDVFCSKLLSSMWDNKLHRLSCPNILGMFLFQSPSQDRNLGRTTSLLITSHNQHVKMICILKNSDSEFLFYVQQSVNWHSSLYFSLLPLI